VVVLLFLLRFRARGVESVFVVVCKYIMKTVDSGHQHYAADLANFSELMSATGLSF